MSVLSYKKWDNFVDESDEEEAATRTPAMKSSLAKISAASTERRQIVVDIVSDPNCSRCGVLVRASCVRSSSWHERRVL